MTATLFVNKAGIFGDNRTCNANRHLQTQRHNDAVSNKLAFNNLSKRQTDVWKLLQEAALSEEISVTATNHFVIKSFFQITWLLIKKNWAHSHNFKSIVELVDACGGEEIKKHHKTQIICHLNTFPNIFKSWMITSSHLFLHHFVLLAHLHFLTMKLQTS